MRFGQEILAYMNKANQEIDRDMEQKYGQRAQALAQRLMQTLTKCVNMGSTPEECERKYLKPE